MTETFAPCVMVDGRTFEPPGWMWVLGFALSGREWAIREAETEAFKAVMRTWLKARDDHHRAGMIRDLERRLAELKIDLNEPLLDDTPPKP